MAKQKGFHEGFREGAKAAREQDIAALSKAHPAAMMTIYEIVKFLAALPLPEPVKDQTQSSE